MKNKTIIFTIVVVTIIIITFFVFLKLTSDSSNPNCQNIEIIYDKNLISLENDGLIELSCITGSDTLKISNKSNFIYSTLCVENQKTLMDDIYFFDNNNFEKPRPFEYLALNASSDVRCFNYDRYTSNRKDFITFQRSNNPSGDNIIKITLLE